MSTNGSKKYRGLFFLIAVNFFMFLLINVLKLPLQQLFLDHHNPRWYQFATALFCHFNYTHLSGNMFFLYIFGRLIEEEEQMTGILVSYFICGIAANIFTFVFSTNDGYSLGASGAVFGLFTIAMLLKFKFRLFNLFEIVILAPFVIGYILQEFKNLGNSDHIAHDAHLYGAGAGILLILGLKYLNKKL